MNIRHLCVLYMLLHIQLTWAAANNTKFTTTKDTIVAQQDSQKEETTTNNILHHKREHTLDGQIADTYTYIQTPITYFSTLDIKSFFAGFKFNEPWYVLPAYYSVSSMYSPDLTRTEIKSQISFRLELLNDVMCKFCAFSFDYTQKIYLQTYNDKESAPLRDIDLSPAINFVYKKPIPIENGNFGYFNWFSIGYRHVSNGERENKNMFDPRQKAWGGNFVRSKAFDRFIFETNYKHKDFNARLRTWLNISAIAYDGAKTNGDIDKYMGYADLKLSYTYKNNHLEMYLNNIVNNYFTKEYWNWKGHIELGYSYGVSKRYAIYVQYLYGYGDSLYEYSLPVNRIGIGVRLRDF